MQQVQRSTQERITICACMPSQLFHGCDAVPCHRADGRLIVHMNRSTMHSHASIICQAHASKHNHSSHAFPHSIHTPDTPWWHMPAVPTTEATMHNHCMAHSSGLTHLLEHSQDPMQCRLPTECGNNLLRLQWNHPLDAAWSSQQPLSRTVSIRSHDCRSHEAQDSCDMLTVGVTTPG